MRGFFIFISILSCQVIFAQGERHSFGVRGCIGSYGPSLELSSRHKIPELFRLEFSGGTRFNSDDINLVANAHFQYVRPFSEILSFYVGIGYHYSYSKTRFQFQISTSHDVGLSLITGLDINFKKFALSLDLRPNFDLYQNYWLAYEVAVGLRYKVF